MTTKSPLRYAGGKTRAVKAIIQHIPHDITELVSPFIGGGSVELALAHRGVRVYGYDINTPLCSFWHWALCHPKELADAARAFHPMTKQQFTTLQQAMKKHADLYYYDPAFKHHLGAAFYALNRASWGGCGLYGGFSKDNPRFTTKGIDELARFDAPNLSVCNLGFTQSINTIGKGRFLYCDPPYKVKSKLYEGHADFDHEGLAQILTARGDWLLSYNDCPMVRDLYPEKNHAILEIKYPYGMNKTKQSNEILIFSADRQPINDRLI